MEAVSSVGGRPLGSSATAGEIENLELLISDLPAEEEELLPDRVLSRKCDDGEVSALPRRDLKSPPTLAREGEDDSSRLGGDEASVDEAVLLLDLDSRLRAVAGVCLLNDGGRGRLLFAS